MSDVVGPGLHGRPGLASPKPLPCPRPPEQPLYHSHIIATSCRCSWAWLGSPHPPQQRRGLWELRLQALHSDHEQGTRVMIP